MTSIYTIVWKWKANVEDYVGKPGVVGIQISTWDHPHDDCLVGRSGWVGFKKEVTT